VNPRVRRPVLSQGVDRGIVHLGLLVVCVMLAVLGLGMTALLCFFPAAALMELLSRAVPRAPSRRM